MRYLFKPLSYQSGTAMAVGATFVWKIISFINALLIAAFFGAGDATDIYFYLLIIMGIGVSFVQRVNASLVIPEAMSLDAQTPQGGRGLLSLFLYVYGAFFVLLTLAGAFTPVWLGHLISRFSLAQLNAHRLLLVWGFGLFGLQLLYAYLVSVLEMYRRFASSLFAPLNAILPLLALLVLGKFCGIESMIYGFIASYSIQIVMFLWIMKKELHWQFLYPPHWPKGRFTRNWWSLQVMEIITLASSFLPMYLLSAFSAGIVSALNYAKQLTDSATEVFSLRVSNISKIQLTEDLTHHNWNIANNNFLANYHTLLFILTPLAVFSCFFAPQIVYIFFARGQFDQEAAWRVTAFLRPLLAVMWAVIPVFMLSNVTVAGRKVKESLPYGLFSSLLFIVFIFVAIRKGGPFAFPYVLLVYYAVSSILTNIFLKRHFPQFALKRSWKMAARLLAINLGALVPCAIGYALLPHTNAWLTVIFYGIIYVVSLGGICRVSGDLKYFLENTHLHALLRK